METTTNGEAATIDVFVEAAHQFVLHGAVPVPLRDGKNPNFSEWQKFEFDEQRFRQKLRTATEPGVGVLFGPRSRIVDFEYDTPAQRDKILELFNGDLLIGPQYTSKQGEHWWFAWDDRLETCNKAVVSIPCRDGTQLKVRIGAAGKGAQSAAPPSPNKVWKPGLSLDDCAPPKLPDDVVEALIRYANPQVVSDSQQGNADGEVHEAALDAMRRIRDNDNGDGSKRLFACACRCVEHDLTDGESLATIREYERQRPFPNRSGRCLIRLQRHS